MEQKLEPLFRVRVLVEYDPTYQVHVARCLETGSVVTADDAETAWEMIRELLDDEISYAIEHRNLSNLFSSPAPLDIWVRWRDLVRNSQVPTENVMIKAQELRFDRPEVETEVAMARTI